MGAVGIGITTDIDGMGATDGGLVFKLMSALLGNGVEHGYSLFHDLRSDTIALENRNFQFHITSFLFGNGLQDFRTFIPCFNQSF
jgi:hypothetical protein